MDIDCVFITKLFIQKKRTSGEKSLAMLTEVEDPERKKVELEDELQLLTEREKALEEDVKTLEVEVAVRKLEEKIKAKQEAVEKLETKKSELEKEMKEPETSETTEGLKPKDTEGVEEEQETDLTLSAVPDEDHEPTQSQEQHEEGGKKRHRFFHTRSGNNSVSVSLERL